MSKLPYEARFYAHTCEWKPFATTKHKCLRCRECVPEQYFWCLNNPTLRKELDKCMLEVSNEQ